MVCPKIAKIVISNASGDFVKADKGALKRAEVLATNGNMQKQPIKDD